jgi:hypothetical protein
MISKAFLLLLLFLPIQDVAAELPRLAVIPFNAVGVSEQDAQSISLLFETELQKTEAFTLIEMLKVDRIINAQKYSLSGIVDESQAVEIGRLLAADQIVIGSVGKVAALYYLTVKILDVETGEYITAENAQAQSLTILLSELSGVASVLAGKEPVASSINHRAETIVDKAAVYEIRYYDNGRYEGEWVAGMKNGTGTYYYSNGNRYEGEWRDNLMHGTGTFYFATRDRYVGAFSNGMIQGYGTFYFADGGRYDGEFSDGKKNGQGTRYYATGDRYEGEYRDDKFNGYGVYYHTNGGRYEGEHRDGVRNGQGIYYFANGNRYEGAWSDDKKNGIGVAYFTNGNRYEGEWRDDELIAGTYYSTDGTPP